MGSLETLRHRRLPQPDHTEDAVASRAQVLNQLRARRQAGLVGKQTEGRRCLRVLTRLLGKLEGHRLQGTLEASL